MELDEIYEFSAPKFYDFTNGESEDEKMNSELWFETAISHAPSLGNSTPANTASTGMGGEPKLTIDQSLTRDIPSTEIIKSIEPTTSSRIADTVCTPEPPVLSVKKDPTLMMSKGQKTARNIASLVKKNPSALKTKGQCQQSQSKSSQPASTRRDIREKSSLGTPSLANENQAVKRQKLEGGNSKKILNIKPPTLSHKSRLGSSKDTTTGALSAKTRIEDRKVYVREPAAAFVSTAEMVKKFQSSTRDLSLPKNSVSHGTLTLTRPKEPNFETAQRARPVRVKSSAEIEEEIFEAPTLPPIHKIIPRPPQFQEFHLETMARASKSDTASVVSTESNCQKNNHPWKPHRLTEPKTPLLQTFLRARPNKVKSSLEIEEEELEKIPKFKARPLNKKIFESKGDLGLFCNNKKQVTIPHEFHFAIDERIPPPQPPTTMVFDLFDKLSISSNSSHDNIPRITKPNPFQLHTKERGAEKEMRFLNELLHKELEEERARIPKAKPYPYSTDFPVVPPKPEAKHCTRPEPFQLESLVRHEMEMQREMQERLRKERQEAQMRIFKAQPVLKEDPIPVPEKERKPLTEVQEFNLHVVHRAVERSEFDKKVKEKEVFYKRYREEQEAAKMMEEEKALKHLRRTLVPHARPLPKFANPFMPQKSCKETTKAKSPSLRISHRKERRSTVRAISTAITTSPAYQMR
ncbi:hypothetical protein V2J09_000060 [Rumex salicifolius]